MSAVLDHPASSLESAPATPANLPTWFADRRRAAWQRFLETPTPARGDERWRFSNLKQLDFSGFAPAAAEAAGNFAARSEGVASPAAKLVFVNDELVHREASLPEGAICLPLADALVSHGDLVREHFMKQGTRLGSEKWTALHEAHIRNGLFVFVPEGVEIEGAIEVFHWIVGANVAVYPHTLVVAGRGAKVRVIDYFQSANDSDPALAIAVNDLIASDGATLDYVAVQALNDQTKVVQVNDTGAGAGASTTGFTLNVGAAWARNESVTRLLGREARSNMLSVSVPMATQEYDQRTFQHHVSPGAFSDLLYKNTLYDRSRIIFSGLISVDEGAHETDAYQTCRNLFMSDDAEANSMPGLEINADQVKCSHGSTSAQVSEEEIFYLRSRGIDPVRARQLIARGFSVEAIERLGHAETEEVVLRFLDEKFAVIGRANA